jgi:uncharacterized membrane protein YeaQ/YmgE (transglycosylase-associated protein family)
MGILFWIIFGGLVGWVASLVMGTDSQQGIILNIVVGVIGAFIGGWLAGVMGGTGVTGFNLYSFAVATIGAIVLIVIVKAVTGRRI